MFNLLQVQAYFNLVGDEALEDKLRSKVDKFILNKLINFYLETLATANATTGAVEFDMLMSAANATMDVSDIFADPTDDPATTEATNKFIALRSSVQSTLQGELGY